MKLENKRVIIKLGTSTLAHSTGRLNIRNIRHICRILSDLKNAGNEVILVSSGAIGMGVGKLGLSEKPSDIPTKQAAAAIGQCELMYTYDKLFAEYSHTVGQILLTGSDVKNEERFTNFKNTINRLLELSVIPIINENDTIATDEIVIGDNDTLAAIVAVSINADLLVLLSDIDGLYTADPHKDKNGKLIEIIDEITPDIIALGGGEGSSLGTGGMSTKIKAAQIATEAGCDLIIANGQHPELLYDLADGKPIGSLFKARR
ncbi:MAG: glutamate 5-kinase [Acutalibacteraceae bacterium]